MATIALKHNARPERDGWRWWIVKDGRDDYDFNGRPFWPEDGALALSNDELRQAHELARANCIEPDAMWFGSDALQVLQNESDESWDEFMRDYDNSNDWDVQQEMQRVYPGSF